MNATVEAKRYDLIERIKDNPFVKKHLYPHSWISGSTTEVYPIMLWTDLVDIQWNSDRPCNKWIKAFAEKHSDMIEYGYFDKSDGSCPSAVIFVLKDKFRTPQFLYYAA